MSDNKKIKIEKVIMGIPMNRKFKYPFLAMEVGDSFFVPLPPNKNADLLLNNMQGLSSKYGKIMNAIFFAERVKKGIRVWRLPDDAKRQYVFPIEQGIDIPEREFGTRYPFPLMEITNSFFVPTERRYIQKTVRHLQHLAYQHIQRKSTINKDKEFICRRYDDGVRVWRIK